MQELDARGVLLVGVHAQHDRVVFLEAPERAHLGARAVGVRVGDAHVQVEHPVDQQQLQVRKADMARVPQPGGGAEHQRARGQAGLGQFLRPRRIEEAGRADHHGDVVLRPALVGDARGQQRHGGVDCAEIDARVADRRVGAYEPAHVAEQRGQRDAPVRGHQLRGEDRR